MVGVFFRWRRADSASLGRRVLMPKYLVGSGVLAWSIAVFWLTVCVWVSIMAQQ